MKFYTEDGNWDLVGNNLAVVFIRDAIKFPDFIHSQKPDRGSASTPTSGSTRRAKPVLVKYHWIPKQGVKSWSAADASAVPAKDSDVPGQNPRATA